jgi:hypothetical protein
MQCIIQILIIGTGEPDWVSSLVSIRSEVWTENTLILRLWLWYWVLWVDTNVSEECAASIFRVEVCRLTNRLHYVSMLPERCACHPLEPWEALNLPSSQFRILSCEVNWEWLWNWPCFSLFKQQWIPGKIHSFSLFQFLPVMLNNCASCSFFVCFFLLT